MKTKYVIFNPSNQGYWSSSHKNFKGLLFAQEYDSLEEVKEEIKNMLEKWSDVKLEIKNFYCN